MDYLRPPSFFLLSSFFCISSGPPQPFHFFTPSGYELSNDFRFYVWFTTFLDAMAIQLHLRPPLLRRPPQASPANFLVSPKHPLSRGFRRFTPDSASTVCLLRSLSLWPLRKLSFSQSSLAVYSTMPIYNRSFFQVLSSTSGRAPIFF